MFGGKHVARNTSNRDYFGAFFFKKVFGLQGRVYTSQCGFDCVNHGRAALAAVLRPCDIYKQHRLMTSCFASGMSRLHSVQTVGYRQPLPLFMTTTGRCSKVDVFLPGGAGLPIQSVSLIVTRAATFAGQRSLNPVRQAQPKEKSIRSRAIPKKHRINH